MLLHLKREKPAIVAGFRFSLHLSSVFTGMFRFVLHRIQTAIMYESCQAEFPR